jgi:hypothetical protein
MGRCGYTCSTLETKFTQAIIDIVNLELELEREDSRKERDEQAKR